MAWGFFYLADFTETRYPRGLSRILFGRSGFLSGGRS